MPMKKEPTIRVELTQGLFVTLNYYQIAYVVDIRNEAGEIVQVTFGMTTGKTFDLAKEAAVSAFSQYQRIINKEND